MYVRRPPTCPRIVGARFRPVYKVVYNKFYIDEFYARHRSCGWPSTARAGCGITSTSTSSTGRCTASAWLWQHAGSAGRGPLQTGRVQNYLLGMFIGVFVIVTVIGRSGRVKWMLHDDGFGPSSPSCPWPARWSCWSSCAGGPSAYKMTALVTSIITLALAIYLATQFQTGTADFQFQENVSLDRQPGHLLPPGRRRHLPAPDPADHAALGGGHPRLLELHQGPRAWPSSSACWCSRPACWACSCPWTSSCSTCSGRSSSSPCTSSSACGAARAGSTRPSSSSSSPSPARC